jgi:hypothetical protein
MSCQIKTWYPDEALVSCDEIRTWKEKFRAQNGTDIILKSGGRDRYYEEYCGMVDYLLKDCKCEARIPLKCNVCKEEEHEGYLKSFCRCEMRNIALARQHRKDGWTPDWKGNSDALPKV